MTTIYTLSCPNTKNVFYVGQTTKDLNIRLSGHMRGSIVMGQDARPIIETVEQCENKDAHRLEAFWIHQFLVWGFDLKNSIRNFKYPNRAGRKSDLDVIIKKRLRNKWIRLGEHGDYPVLAKELNVPYRTILNMFYYCKGQPDHIKQVKRFYEKRDAQIKRILKVA